MIKQIRKEIAIEGEIDYSLLVYKEQCKEYRDLVAGYGMLKDNGAKLDIEEWKEQIDTAFESANDVWRVLKILQKFYPGKFAISVARI